MTTAGDRVFNANGLLTWNRATLPERMATSIQGIATRLTRNGFDGSIVFEAHLGRFKIVEENGDFRLATNADAQNPVLAAAIHEMSAEYAIGLGQRHAKSVRDAFTVQGINSENLSAESHGVSRDLVPYPLDVGDVEKWNAIAAQNNRVLLRLIPREGPEISTPVEKL